MDDDIPPTAPIYGGDIETPTFRPTKHPRAPSPAMRNIAHRICGRILVTILPITSASYLMNTGSSTTPSCTVLTDTEEFRTRSALSISPSSPILTLSRTTLPISK